MHDEKNKQLYDRSTSYPPMRAGRSCTALFGLALGASLWGFQALSLPVGFRVSGLGV